MTETAYEMGKATVFRCALCDLQYWDASTRDVEDHYVHEHMRTHAAPKEADRGGAMDSSCVICHQPITRRSFGSFVGDWEA